MAGQVKTDYRVTGQYRVGDRWYEEGDQVSLTDVEAEFPRGRGWIKPDKTKATEKVSEDAK